jgi:hypothetical protein
MQGRPCRSLEHLSPHAPLPTSLPCIKSKVSYHTLAQLASKSPRPAGLRVCCAFLDSALTALTFMTARQLALSIPVVVDIFECKSYEGSLGAGWRGPALFSSQRLAAAPALQHRCQNSLRRIHFYFCLALESGGVLGFWVRRGWLVLLAGL